MRQGEWKAWWKASARRARGLAAILGLTHLPLCARVELVLAHLVAARRDRTLSLGIGTVVISGDDSDTDRRVFEEVFRYDCYPLDCAGRVVVDIGAHKGYFGAHALLRGAAAVVSFEPESVNFSYLERAASTFRARGHIWHTRPVAVGDQDGETTLFTSTRSWAHTIVADRQSESRENAIHLGEPLGTEAVGVVSLETALADAAAFGSPLVVKIDAEGSECAIVLKAAHEIWDPVCQAFVERHPWAPCDFAAIAGRLAETGLMPRDEAHDVVRFERAGTA